MTIRQTQEKAIREYAVNSGILTDEIRSLIADATSDLYNGPGCDTSEGYPGFERACRQIGDALPHGDLWVSIDGEVMDSEPQWATDDDDDEDCGEYPDAWACFDASTVKRILVGRELSQYL